MTLHQLFIKYNCPTGIHCERCRDVRLGRGVRGPLGAFDCPSGKPWTLEGQVVADALAKSMLRDVEKVDQSYVPAIHFHAGGCWCGGEELTPPAGVE